MKAKSETQRVRIDFPAEFANRLFAAAERRRVTPQDLIKVWIADRLDRAT